MLARYGWSWYCIRSLHHHRIRSTTRKASRLHRHPRSSLRLRQRHRSPSRGRLHLKSHMAMVVRPSSRLNMILTNTTRSFYINLPVGGASALVILLFFQTPSASKPAKASKLEKFLQMDPLGTIVIMGAIVSYLLALQWGGTTKPWSSGDVIATLVAFAVLIIVFVVVEWWMGDRAILQGSLLKRRDIMVPCIFNFL